MDEFPSCYKSFRNPICIARVLTHGLLLNVAAFAGLLSDVFLTVCVAQPHVEANPPELVAPSVVLTAAVTVWLLPELSSTGEAGFEVKLERGGRTVAEGTTNGEGKFKTTVPRGWYTVTAQKPGFCSVVSREFVDDDDFELRYAPLRPADIHGTLRFQGRSYPNATLRLEDPDRPACAATVTSDVEGNFSGAGVSPNAGVAPIGHVRGHAIAVEPDRFSRDDGLRINVVDEEVFPVHVRVLDVQGNLLPDAQITVIPPIASKPALTAWTHGSGHVQLPAAQSQLNRVVATVFSDDGRRVVWKDVRADAEHPQTSLILKPLSRKVRIRGLIHDDLGRPAPSVPVFASTVRAVVPVDEAYSRPGDLPKEYATAVSDANGRFVIEGLRPDHIYRVTTTRHENDQPQVYVCPNSGEVALEYRPWRKHRMIGRLVDSSGQPVRQGEIVGGQSRLDANGYFEVSGSRSFVEAKGYLRTLLEVTEPNEAFDVNLGNVVLRRVRSIHGRVFRFDGQPAAGVSGRMTAPDATDQYSSSSRGTTFQVGSDGAFTLPDFADGKVRVSIFDGDAGVGQVELATQESEFVLRLEAPATVTGTLFDPQGRPRSGQPIYAICASDARSTKTDERGNFNLRGLQAECVVGGRDEILPNARSYIPSQRVSLRPGESKTVELRTQQSRLPPERTVDLHVSHSFRSHYRSSHLFRGDVAPPHHAQSWMDYEPGSVLEHPKQPFDSLIPRSAADEWELLEPGTYTLFVLEPRGDSATPVRQVLYLDKPGAVVVYPQLAGYPLTCGP
jgi:hypothetical protein